MTHGMEAWTLLNFAACKFSVKGHFRIPHFQFIYLFGPFTESQVHNSPQGEPSLKPVAPPPGQDRGTIEMQRAAPSELTILLGRKG